ncbi:MAG: Asp23/Gls24 family envelope stress response protein [Candidatus Omnitrophica bacterium]|nr:Asp23/Gls24 family envelope stress response protein [Candidatus Omnitrophota bacterium]
MPRKTDLGTVSIHHEVIGSIAAAAAKEVAGVAGVWKGFFPWGSASGVKVLTRDQETRIWISLVVDYGVSLPQMASQVQERVSEMVERMTHLAVTEVHVSIAHVHGKGDA